MDFFESTKELFSVLFAVFMKVPIQYTIGVVVFFIIAILLTSAVFAMCESIIKKAKKTNIVPAKVESFLPEIEDKVVEGTIEDKVVEDTIEDKVVEDLVHKKEEKRFESVVHFEEIDKYEMQMESMPVKKDVDLKIEPYISDFIIHEYHYNNVKTNNNHKIDKIIINNKGVFIIFEMNKLKGNLSGDQNDEYIKQNNKLIVNPTLQKQVYKNKINELLGTDIEKIQIVVISKSVNTLESLNIYKSIEDLLSCFENKEDVYTDDETFEMDGKINFLDKKK